jgi:hypothetical protein
MGAHDLIAGELRIEEHAATNGDGPVTLIWRGKSTERRPDQVLSPYFLGLVDDPAVAARGVEMHFQHLVHFNSSTITTIIQLINLARERNVKLVLVYDQQLKWQKLSFDALRVFAKDNLLELRSCGST